MWTPKLDPQGCPLPTASRVASCSLSRMRSQLVLPAFSLTPVPFPTLYHLYRNVPIFPTRVDSPVTFSQKLSLTLCPHVLRSDRLPPPSVLCLPLVCELLRAKTTSLISLFSVSGTSLGTQ